MIVAIGFHRNLNDKRNEVFVTNLCEINRILKGKGDARQRETAETKQAIPAEYHDFADVFSKIDSDVLPPYRGSTDHRILLEGRCKPWILPALQAVRKRASGNTGIHYEGPRAGIHCAQ
jgi:hypothetical protein